MKTNEIKRHVTKCLLWSFFQTNRYIIPIRMTVSLALELELQSALKLYSAIKIKYNIQLK